MSQIDARSFREQIAFLKSETTLVSPSEVKGQWHSASPRPRVLLTFDDGLLNHVNVVAPILRSANVPALFFVCRRSSEERKYLWFTYLYALERWFARSEFEFRGCRMDMSLLKRAGTIASLRRTLLGLKPHPSAMYLAIERELPPLEEFVDPEVITDCYAGLRAADIRSLASDRLFSVGAHTVDHPYLTFCDSEERKRQIVMCKEWLEATTGVRCDAIAYPAGDYDGAVVKDCIDAGMERGYAVDSRSKGPFQWEVPRFGVYRSNVHLLSIKVLGGYLLRGLRLKIG